MSQVKFKLYKIILKGIDLIDLIDPIDIFDVILAEIEQAHKKPVLLFEISLYYHNDGDPIVPKIYGPFLLENDKGYWYDNQEDSVLYKDGGFPFIDLTGVLDSDSLTFLNLLIGKFPQILWDCAASRVEPIYSGYAKSVFFFLKRNESGQVDFVPVPLSYEDTTQ